jgi:hypothetical protein
MPAGKRKVASNARRSRRRDQTKHYSPRGNRSR